MLFGEPLRSHPNGSFRLIDTAHSACTATMCRGRVTEVEIRSVDDDDDDLVDTVSGGSELGSRKRFRSYATALFNAK